MEQDVHKIICVHLYNMVIINGLPSNLRTRMYTRFLTKNFKFRIVEPNFATNQILKNDEIKITFFCINVISAISCCF